MNILIIAIISGLLFYILYYVRTTPAQSGIAGYLLRKSRKKQEAKEEIGYIQQHKKITNKEARDILKVSERTVVRYMDELEKEDLIEQVGDIGQGVFYRLKNRLS